MLVLSARADRPRSLLGSFQPLTKFRPQPSRFAHKCRRAHDARNRPADFRQKSNACARRQILEERLFREHR